MDPPIIINIFEWRRLWNNEEDDEDDELGMENWVTQKLVDQMCDLLGIPIEMECMDWDRTGRITKLEIIVPEDTTDEYCEDMFDSIKIQQILDALLEEMMEKMRQRLAARPKARKIKFVLDTGKQVPQRKKGVSGKRKVKRVSPQDLQTEPYKRRKGMWVSDYNKKGPIGYLRSENERLKTLYLAGWISNQRLLSFFIDHLRPKLNELLDGNSELVDHYIDTIVETGKTPDQAEKIIDETVEKYIMELLALYEETLQKKSDLIRCLTAIEQKYPLNHIIEVIHSYPPSFQKNLLTQWLTLTLNRFS